MTPPVDGQVQMQVLYWGLAFAIALIGSLWKAARMRGDVHKEWSNRIEVLEAALTERALRELSLLRRRIDALIGGSGEEFDPTSAVIDPGVLLQSVSKFERLISARRRAKRLFRTLLGLGTPLVLSLLALLVSETAGAVHLSGLHDLSPYRHWIYGAFALGASAGSVLFLLYWHLHHQLSSAEILAGSEETGAK